MVQKIILFLSIVVPSFALAENAALECTCTIVDKKSAETKHFEKRRFDFNDKSARSPTTLLETKNYQISVDYFAVTPNAIQG